MREIMVIVYHDSQSCRLTSAASLSLAAGSSHGNAKVTMLASVKKVLNGVLDSHS